MDFNWTPEESLNTIINVDLHIHSKISEYKENNNIVSKSTFDNIDVLLSKLDENKINLFSFTDHNRFDKDLFIKTFTYIHSENNPYKSVRNIIPGVEFDVYLSEDTNKSCHIIVIFDAKTTQDLDSISNTLSKCELRDRDDSYSIEEFQKLLKTIGLSTLLIACQRQGLTHKGNAKNCLSNSTEHPLELLSTGYISALEYQKPHVEGILLNNLKELPNEIALVAGSDCHEWSAYPYHDLRSEKIEKSFCFKAKCQPTFMGLVLSFTSPRTRFKRSTNTYNSMQSFNLDGKKYYLSNGFNAIIGENGSGKSTLLIGLSKESNKKEFKYAKKLLDSNKFKVEKNTFSDKVINQSELIKKDNENKNFWDDSTFENPDTSTFTTSLDQYIIELIKSINNNIKCYNELNKINGKNFVFNSDYEDIKTFYPSFENKNKDKELKNDFRDRIISLNKIATSLKDELKYNNIYSVENIKVINSMKEQINSLIESLYEKFETKEASNKIINLITTTIENYTSKIETKITSRDKEVIDYKKGKQDFKNTIIQAVRASISFVSGIDKKIDTSNGLSTKHKNGFIFSSYTNYYNSKNIEDDLIKFVFNKKYNTVEKILKIETQDEFKSAVSNVKNNDFNSTLNKNKDNFKNEMVEINKEIKHESGKNSIGNTLGEKSICFYDYLLSDPSSFDILFIDQPEDNISNNKISNDLINFLEKIRDKKQLIIVTHNPILVINLDVDNVISMNLINDKFDIKCGCLERKGILEDISLKMDGGKEAIKKRLKLYE